MIHQTASICDIRIPIINKNRDEPLVHYLDIASIKDTYPFRKNLPDRMPILTKLSHFKDIAPSDDLYAAVTIQAHFSDLKKVTEELKRGEKWEKLHKVLSVIALAVTIGLIALAIISIPLTAICPCVIPLGILAGLAGAGLGYLLERYRAGDQANTLPVLIDGLTGGLALPIHYVIAAYRRRPTLEAQIEHEKGWAEALFNVFRTFLQANKETLRLGIQEKLEKESNELNIKLYKQTLAELEAAIIFYLDDAQK